MAANLINQLSTANTFQHWLQATESLISTVNLVTNGNGDNFYANTHLFVGGSDASLNVVTGASINVTTGNTVNTINLEARSTVFSGNVTSRATLTMDTGAGLYTFGEKIYQSNDATLANAFATGLVYGWNSSTKALDIVQVTGDFVQNANTYGASSAANWKTITTGAGFSWTRPNIAIPSNVNIKRDLYVDGDVVVSGNITLDTVGFDDLAVSGSGTFGNTLSVTGTTTLSNVTVLGNVSTLNVTNKASFGNDVLVSGDLTVSGNIILDAVGFDDLNANGSVSVGNNLTVTGLTTLTGVATIANANVAILSGSANTLLFNAITEAKAEAVAFSIALG